MKTAHQNICRGVRNKIDLIERIIAENNYKAFGLSELDLDQIELLPTLKGYDFIEPNAENKRVGM